MKGVQNLIYLPQLLARFMLKRIVFVVGGSSEFPKLYARVVLPLMATAQKKGITSIVVPVTAYMRDWLLQQGVKPELCYFPFGGFTLNLALVVVQLGFKVVRLWTRLLTFYKSKIESQTIKDQVKLGISHKVFSLMHRKEISRVLTDNKPDVVFCLPDIEDWAATMLRTAKRLDIPTLTASCTMIDGTFPYGILIADKVAVSGEAFRQVYLSRGNAGSRIEVTGMAYFDLIMNRNKELDLANLEATGLNPNERFILFVTENNGFEPTMKWLRATLSALWMLRLPRMQLLIKIHPREKEEVFSRAIRDFIDLLRERDHYNMSVVVSKRLDTYSALAQAELVIGGFSTCLWESMVFDKSILTLNYKGSERVPYAQLGAALKIMSPDSGKIADSIKQCLYNPETQASLSKGRQKFLDLYSYKIDGNACERILEVMEKMAA